MDGFRNLPITMFVKVGRNKNDTKDFVNNKEKLKLKNLLNIILRQLQIKAEILNPKKQICPMSGKSFILRYLFNQISKSSQFHIQNILGNCYNYWCIRQKGWKGDLSALKNLLRLKIYFLGHCKTLFRKIIGSHMLTFMLFFVLQLQVSQ